MNGSSSTGPTRREFVTGFARWSALVGLAGISASLLTRGSPRGGNGSCSIAPACGGCPAWTTCRRPQRAPRPEQT